MTPDGRTEYLCIECYHEPSVHGITTGTGPILAPCDCCERPAVIAAAQDTLDLNPRSTPA